MDNTQTPPQAQQGYVDVYLSSEEAAFLQRTQRDPVDYVAMVAPASDRGVGVVQHPQGKAVVMQITVVIPYDALPLKLSGLLGPDGNQQAGRGVLDQIPGAPMVRMLIAKTALGGALRAYVDGQVAAMVAAAEAPAGEPLPMGSRVVIPGGAS